MHGEGGQPNVNSNREHYHSGAFCRNAHHRRFPYRIQQPTDRESRTYTKDPIRFGHLDQHDTCIDYHPLASYEYIYLDLLEEPNTRQHRKRCSVQSHDTCKCCRQFENTRTIENWEIRCIRDSYYLKLLPVVLDSKSPCVCYCLPTDDSR